MPKIVCSKCDSELKWYGIEGKLQEDIINKGEATLTYECSSCQHDITIIVKAVGVVESMDITKK